MKFFGIDVSEHNGSIDWNEASKHIDFAILRIGWVGNKNNHKLDKKFEEFYKQAKAAGVKLGAYVYMYTKSEETAKLGAEWAIEQLKGKEFELPIYCDMEDKSIAGLGKTKLTEITKAFNNVLEEAGYWAGIYASRNWFDNYLEDGIEKRFTSWIAHYTSSSNKYEDEYDMWQNSSSGRVQGISGRVDTNYLYRDLFSEVGHNTENKPPETKPDFKPQSELNYIDPVKYSNGSTPEPTYCNNNLSSKIGSLDPNEKADSYGKYGNKTLVAYKLSNGFHKVGFVDYEGKNPKAVGEWGADWKNGSTPEPVYAESNCKTKIGSIDPYEMCKCLNEYDGSYLVCYKVNGTNTFKAGFVKYHGDLK